MTSITDAVAQTGNRVRDLGRASQEIGEIVTAINEIVGQTRLLALNASIEAARAGEAGRGFAVVATEVKALSQQTSVAISDIRQRISALQNDMQAIQQTMEQTQQAVSAGRAVMVDVDQQTEQVDVQIAQVAGRMADAARTVAEQSAATANVAENVTWVSHRTQDNIRHLQRSVAASGQLESIASKQIAQLVSLDLPAKIVRVAKSDHVFWKKRLADMMAGIVQLRVDELADHRGCRLGRWYYSDNSRCARHLAAFGALEEPHAAVHAAGMAAVAAFNAGDVDGAIAHIARVEEASREVLRLLGEVERGVVATHADEACA